MSANSVDIRSDCVVVGASFAGLACATALATSGMQVTVLERKGDSGARVRSYGMKVTPYFPYLKLGIAYYHLDQLDAALQAFETEVRLEAIASSDTASAELERYRARLQSIEGDEPLFFHPSADIKDYRLVAGIEPATPGQHRGVRKHLPGKVSG